MTSQSTVTMEIIRNQSKPMEKIILESQATRAYQNLLEQLLYQKYQPQNNSDNTRLKKEQNEHPLLWRQP